MVQQYKYYVSGHYPSSCLYLNKLGGVLEKDWKTDNVQEHK
jgi:hypothetical protein